MTIVTEFHFTKRELAQVHSVHLPYLIAGAHACNELNAIRLYFIFERNDLVEKSAEKPFVTIRQMVLLRHLAAKLFEFNKMTIRYFGRIKKLYPQKAKTYQAQYLPIALKMRNFRELSDLRNKMAFHFDEERYYDQFKTINDDQELTFTVGSKQGETAFIFAEEIVSIPYFSKVGNGNIRKGLEETAQFANKTTSDVLKFYASFHIGIAEQYGLLRKKRAYEVNPNSVGIYGKDFIPVFTSRNLKIRTRNISGEFIDE
jgi:hypothetical protein